MSLADKIFVDMCKDIIENGTSTEGEKVRPVWPDGTSAYTIKKFGVVNRYDLSKEFPALTLRKTAIKKKVPYITTIAAAKATADGIKAMNKPGCGVVKSLQELHAEITDKE